MKQFHPIATSIVLAAIAWGAQAHGAGHAAAPAQRLVVSRSGAAGVSSQDRAFMKNAAQAGKAEVQASNMAVQKATDAAVRQFAQRMVQDQSKSNARLEQLARSKGVRLPIELSVARQGKLDILKTARGDRFDNEYARNFGVSAQEQAIGLFRKEADQGKDPQVRAFAADTLGTLRQNLKLARRMEAGINAQAMGSGRSGNRLAGTGRQGGS